MMRIMLTMANIVQIIIFDMAHTEYIRLTVFWNFRNYCSAHFVFFEITTPVLRIMLAMANIVYIVISDIAHTMYIGFTVFWNFSKLLFVLHSWLFRNYYSGDVHHVSYGKHSSNHHFRHSAHSVYKIYSVFKLFEITVCSSHFDFFEITTPVMRIILIMAKIVQIIISDMAHKVYIRLKVFSNFSKLLFVLHVLTFSKLQLRWCALCQLWQTLFK